MGRHPLTHRLGKPGSSHQAYVCGASPGPGQIWSSRSIAPAGSCTADRAGDVTKLVDGCRSNDRGRNDWVLQQPRNRNLSRLGADLPAERLVCFELVAEAGYARILAALVLRSAYGLLVEARTGPLDRGRRGRTRSRYRHTRGRRSWCRVSQRRARGGWRGRSSSTCQVQSAVTGRPVGFPSGPGRSSESAPSGMSASWHVPSARKSIWPSSSGFTQAPTTSSGSGIGGGIRYWGAFQQPVRVNTRPVAAAVAAIRPADRVTCRRSRWRVGATRATDSRRTACASVTPVSRFRATRTTSSREHMNNLA